MNTKKQLVVENNCLQLAAQWYQVTSQNYTLAEALQAMNETLGTQYTNSRLHEWLDGRRDIPKQVIKYMLIETLPYTLTNAGLSRNKANEITYMINNLI